MKHLRHDNLTGADIESLIIHIGVYTSYILLIDFCNFFVYIVSVTDVCRLFLSNLMSIPWVTLKLRATGKIQMQLQKFPEKIIRQVQTLKSLPLGSTQLGSCMFV